MTQLSTEEQRELACTITTDAEKCSAVQRAKYAEKRLEQLADTKDRELTLYTQLIENLVYLLWRHIHYYTVYCRDVSDEGEPLPKKLLSSNQDNVKQVGICFPCPIMSNRCCGYLLSLSDKDKVIRTMSVMIMYFNFYLYRRE